MLALAQPAAAGVADAVAFGGGDTRAGCITVMGASNAATGRMRWVLAFWPSTAASSPAGTCPEDEPHTEPTVSCTAVATVDGRRVLYLGASDRTGSYAATLIDGGPGTGDEAGFESVSSLAGSRCGADAVATDPIVSGDIAILP